MGPEMASNGSAGFSLQPLTSTNYFRRAIEMECALDMRDLWCAVLEDEEFKAISDEEARKRQSCHELLQTLNH
jgi:hypothetical protein